MTEDIKNIGFFQLGDTFTLKLSTVLNICSYQVKNVEVALTIPPGVVLADYTIPKGQYNTVDNIWSIPTVLPKQLIEPEFTFQITECATSFQFEFNITVPQSCDECFNVPKYCIKVEGLSCCSLLPCIEDLITPGVEKVVYDMNNETEIELGVSVTPNNLLMVTVNGLEVDDQTNAVPGFMYYTLVGSKVVFSSSVTGIGRVKYLKIPG